VYDTKVGLYWRELKSGKTTQAAESTWSFYSGFGVLSQTHRCRQKLKNVLSQTHRCRQKLNTVLLWLTCKASRVSQGPACCPLDNFLKDVGLCAPTGPSVHLGCSQWSRLSARHLPHASAPCACIKLCTLKLCMYKVVHVLSRARIKLCTYKLCTYRLCTH
jgi:hypothetical protein